MTMMADFLLQPATTQGAGRSAVPDTGASAISRPPAGGQDFTRILVQQRQAADVRPAPPVRSRDESVRQPEHRRAENRRDESEPVREPASDSREKASVSVSGEPGDKEGLRQKDDGGATGDGKEADPAPGVDEDNDGFLAVPGLLDPLLEQILLAQEQSGEEVSVFKQDVGEATEGIMAAGSLLAVTQQARTIQEATTQSVDAGTLRQGAGAAEGGNLSAVATKTGAETEAVELVADLLEEGLSPGSQLLAGTAARAERLETGATTIQAAERGVSAGETRTDTLMRSEAVQSAQAARQLQGQPLNMQQPGWSKELTDKVMWMSSQNLKSAEIKLNPAELGRLDIRVQVGQEHTQITFNSAHAGVRDSLDGQMHRLREMLEQQGMHNVDVEVADQSKQHQQQESSRRIADHGAEAGEEELVAVSELEQQEQGHAGLVSYYV